MARRLISVVLPMLLAVGTTQAQLADPTRPAIDTGPTAVTAGGAAQPVATGLQSIIQRKNGKPAALIGGAVIELGGKVGEARLVRVGEDYVVLRGPLGDETLRLTPGIEKQTVKAEKVAKKAMRKEKK
jgi:MSHA biogenesis protein MshK